MRLTARRYCLTERVPNGSSPSRSVHCGPAYVPGAGRSRVRVIVRSATRVFGTGVSPRAAIATIMLNVSGSCSVGAPPNNSQDPRGVRDSTYRVR